MTFFLSFSLLVFTTVSSHWLDDHLQPLIQAQNDDRWTALANDRKSLPNFRGCELTKACYTDLLASTGFTTDHMPNYGKYLMKMTMLYSKGKGLEQYCGTFDAVSRCFAQESDSCRTPTVFETLFDLSSDDAYRYATDLDLRKILCDNQEEMKDPCLNGIAAIRSSIPVEIDAEASCTNIAADLTTVINKADEWGCPDSVLSLFCQISAKTKEIETLGACDGKIPKCWSPFHSCDSMQACFDQFYDGVEKAGVKEPLPDYATYASNMKRRFENAAWIDEMCRMQETLHSCLIRHIDKNCPLNAASFRTMYNMNYEQAYDYSTDFNLRKAQCTNKEGFKESSCLTKAKPLLNVCEPDIPHNLTLGESCTDLRLAMKCNNFAVRQFCPESVQHMYCSTTSIIYQQEALGLCDGWMPDCEIETETTLPETSTEAPLSSPTPTESESLPSTTPVPTTTTTMRRKTTTLPITTTTLKTTTSPLHTNPTTKQNPTTTSTLAQQLAFRQSLFPSLAHSH